MKKTYLAIVLAAAVGLTLVLNNAYKNEMLRLKTKAEDCHWHLILKNDLSDYKCLYICYGIPSSWPTREHLN